MSKATGTTKQGKKSILSIILALLLATSMTPVTQISQAFAADAPASAPAQLTLTDGSATVAIYDKNPATTTHADITLQLQLNGHTLATPIGTLLIDGNALTDGQDYTTTTAPTATTTAITYTIKSATLAAQTTASHTFAIDIADGIPATLPVQIIDTTPVSFPRDGAAVGEERSDERNAGNPAQTPTPTQTIKANYTDTTTNNQYILNYELLPDGTLKATGFAEKTNFNGNLTIPEQLNYNGQTYRVTALAATAFNADPDIVTFFAPSVTDIDNPVIASEAKQSSPQPTTVDTTIPSALSNNPNLLYAALPNAKNLPANLFANNPQLSYIFVPSAQTIAPTAFANLNTKQIDLTLNLALKAQTSGNTYQNQSYRFLSFGNANSTLIYPEDFLTIIANANSNNGENTQNAENTEPANSENSNGNTNSNESDNEGQTPSVTEGINDNEDQSPVATITTNPTDQIKDALTIPEFPKMQLLSAEEIPITTESATPAITIDGNGKITISVTDVPATGTGLKDAVDAILTAPTSQGGGGFATAGEAYANITSLTATGYTTANSSSASAVGFIRTNLTNLTILDLGGTAFSDSWGTANCNFVPLTKLVTVVLPKQGAAYTTANGLFQFTGDTALVSADISGLSAIGNFTFNGATNLTTVFLPASGYTIGTSAFKGTAITSINIGGAISIGNTAFQDCASLASITLPTVAGGYTTGTSAFAGCTSLTSIDLSNAKSIGNAAFNGSAIDTILLPNALPTITATSSNWGSNGSFASLFAESKDTTFLVSDIMAYQSAPDTWAPVPSLLIAPAISGEAIVATGDPITLTANPAKTGAAYQWYKDGEPLSGQTASTLHIVSADADDDGVYRFTFNGLTLPTAQLTVEVEGQTSTFNGAILIEDNEAGGLKSAVDARLFELGKTYADVTSLTATGLFTANSASASDLGFIRTNLTNLTALNLGGTALSGSWGTTNCNFVPLTKLVTVVLPKQGAAYTTANGLFFNHKALESADISGLSAIGDTTFRGANSLTTVVMPRISGYTIGGNAFTSTAITSINISGAVSIGGSAFTRCESLTSIDLSNATKIGTSAFSFCTLLSSVKMPITQGYTVASSMFSSCSALTSIDLSKAGVIDAQAFANCTNLAYITMPAAPFLFGANVNTGSVFLNCTALQSIDLSNLAEDAYISEAQFSGCSNLNTVYMPTHNYAIGFIMANTIEHFVFPYDSTWVDEDGNYRGITQASLKEKVFDADGNWIDTIENVSLRRATRIGVNVFDGNPYFTSIDASSCTTFNDEALKGLANLETVKMPTEGAFTLGKRVFTGDTNLKAIDLSRLALKGLSMEVGSGANKRIVEYSADEGAFLGSGIKTVLLPDVPPMVIEGYDKNWVNEGSFAGLFGSGKSTLFLVSDKTAYEALPDDNIFKKLIINNATDALNVKVPAVEVGGPVRAGEALTLTAVPAIAEGHNYQWYLDDETIADANGVTFIKDEVTSDDEGKVYSFSIDGLTLPTAQLVVAIGNDTVELSDAAVVSYALQTDYHGSDDPDFHPPTGDVDSFTIFDITFDKEIQLKNANSIFNEITLEGNASGWSYEFNNAKNSASVLQDGKTLRLLLHYGNLADNGGVKATANRTDKAILSVTDADGNPVVFPDTEMMHVSPITPLNAQEVVSRRAGTATTPAQTLINVDTPRQSTRGMVFKIFLINGLPLKVGQPSETNSYNPIANMPEHHNFMPFVSINGHLVHQSEAVYNTAKGASTFAWLWAEQIAGSFPGVTYGGTYPGYTATYEGNQVTITSKRNVPGEVIDCYTVSYPRDHAQNNDKTALAAAIASAEAASASDYTVEGFAALNNELAIARAMNAGVYYLQTEVDQQAVKLAAAVADTKPEGPRLSDAAAIGYKAVTGHQGTVNAISGMDDQYLTFDISFDKAITLADASSIFSQITATLGGSDIAAGKSGVPANAAELLDANTLRLTFHIGAAFTGRLNIEATADDNSLTALTDADGKTVVLDDISTIISTVLKDGTEFATVSQTVATSSVAASVTKQLSYPDSATRGQVHFVLLKNGVQVEGNSSAISSGGFIPTTTGHNLNYLSETQEHDLLGYVRSGFASGGELANYDVAVVDDKVTITAKNSVAGDVLDLLIVGYPRDISTKIGGVALPITQDKTALAAAINVALAADPAEFAPENFAALTEQLALAQAVNASVWYFQPEIDAVALALSSALADKGEPPTEPIGDPKVVGYKVWTDHSGARGSSPQSIAHGEALDDDQFVVFQVIYDRAITLASDSHSVFSQFTGSLNSNMDALGIDYPGRPVNEAVVLADGKTLQLTMHMEFRAEDGHLLLTANNTAKTLPAVTSAVGGVAMPFLDVDMFISTGAVLTTLSQTLGTATTPARLVVQIDAPASMTRGMVQFMLLSNGAPALPTVGIYPANVQAHYYKYLDSNSAELAVALAGELGRGGYTADETSNIITITAGSNLPGQVLDLLYIGYPRDRDTLANKVALRAAIDQADAVVAGSAFATDYDEVETAILVKEIAKAKAIDVSNLYLQPEVDAQTAHLLSAIARTYPGDDYDPDAVIPDAFDASKITVDAANKRVELSDSLLKAFVQGNQSSVTVDTGKSVSLDVFSSPSSVKLGQEAADCAGYVLNPAHDVALLDIYGYCKEGGTITTRVSPTVRVVSVNGAPVGLNAGTATASIVDGKLVVTGVAAGTTKVAIEAYVQHPSPGKVEGDLIELADGSKLPWSAWMGSRVSVPVEIAITVNGGATAGDPRGQFELGSDVTGKGIVLSVGGLTDLAAKVQLDGVQLVNGRDYTIAAGANGLGTRVTLLSAFLDSLPANASTTHALKLTFSDGFVLNTSFFDRVTTVIDPNAGAGANTGQAAPTVVTSPVNNNYYSSGGGGYSGGGVATAPAVVSDGTDNAVGSSGPSSRSNATGTDIGDTATPLSGTPNQVSVEGSGDGQLVLTIALVVIALVVGAVAGAVAINAIRRRRAEEAMLG